MDRLLNETYAAQSKLFWLIQASCRSDAGKLELNNAAQVLFRYIDECNKAVVALRIAEENKRFEDLPPRES